jgi:hypothetical protein
MVRIKFGKEAPPEPPPVEVAQTQCNTKCCEVTLRDRLLERRAHLSNELAEIEEVLHFIKTSSYSEYIATLIRQTRSL